MNRELHLDAFLLCCPVCGQHTGIGIPKRMSTEDLGYMEGLDVNPCNDCKKKFETHLIIHEVISKELPTATGRYVWTDRRAINPPLNQENHLNMVQEEFVSFFKHNSNEEN
jgi:tRNA U34 2-thiouridine synthase MnmA/TrmU